MANLEISAVGNRLLDSTLSDLTTERLRFGRNRCRFYLTDAADTGFFTIEMRDILDELVNHFQLANPSADRKSDYSLHLQTIAERILVLQVRENTHGWHIRSDEDATGHLILRIHDPELSEDQIMKWEWAENSFHLLFKGSFHDSPAE
jgi:hypothetical protein